MLFHSFEFLIGFLPAVLCGYLILARFHSHKAVLGWLTASSLIFYGWWNPLYLLLIVGSILGNFLLGRLICPSTAPWEGRYRSPLFAVGIASNLLLLGYFKYANFVAENLEYLVGLHLRLDKVLLPLAISFFTFTQIAYLVDTYRGETKKYGLLDYSFFVTFFPHLIAGPIVLHREIMPQVERRDAFRFTWENVQVGLGIFALGLFKKLVLADGSGEIASPFFAQAVEASSAIPAGDAWTGVLAYSFQLYFDFSGYSDMAIGISRLFGVLLPLNFNSPYRATSIIEFWRRWHISLSRFLRDYLYIPLGGNRLGNATRYTNIMITMILGGLWHGAGWNFAIWGALHGLYLVINHGFRDVCGRLDLRHTIPKSVSALLGWSLTMLAVAIGWVFFRSPDFGTATRIIRSLVGIHDHESPAALSMGSSYGGMDCFWLLGLAAIVLFMPNTQAYFAKFKPALDYKELPLRRWQFVWTPNLLHGLAIGVLVFLSVKRLFQRAPSEFLYFNF